MKSTIQNLIEEAANNKLNGKYNLKQYAEGGKKHAEKVKAMAHKKACEGIVLFIKEHQKEIPLYFILAVGVNDSAYKQSVFEKGYKGFDADKVLAVHKMGMLYNEYNGVKGKMSDVTIRLIKRFYDKVSSDINEFIEALENSKVLGKSATSRETDYKVLCDNLGIPYKD